jgi:pimeloyl-ACP methyl ester carboxylesterase
MSSTAHVNGIDLFYRDTATGDPLVLLHGFTGSGDDWGHVFTEPPPGRRLIVPDLRGHGRSTNPSGRFTFADVADDVFALLDRLGVAEFAAIGMSAGANTLLHLATQQPGRVRAMIHVSGTPRFPEPARAIMRSMTEDSRTDADWAEMRSRHHHGDDQIRALWRHAREFAGDGSDMHFTASTLSAIRARTLIVHGDRDPLYPVELAVELLRSIPDAALWVVPHGGHVPVFAEQRASFVRAAAAFLQ